MADARSMEDRIAREIKQVKKSFLTQARTSDAEISLSLPHALYLTDAQSMLFEAATSGSEEYRARLDNPVSRLIETVSATILDEVGARAHFVDLGPGYPSKSLALIDALAARNVSVTYYAVDISPFFLERAVAAVHQRNMAAHSLHRRFEEIEPILDAKLAPKVPRIVFLGLTYCNFEPAKICGILRSIIRPGDYCLVCSQSADEIDVDTVLAPYRTDSVRSFAFGVLKTIGLRESNLVYEPRFENHCISLGFEVVKEFELAGVVVRAGRKITTAKSYRSPHQATLKLLGENFHLRDVRTDAGSGVSIFLLQGGRQ